MGLEAVKEEVIRNAKEQQSAILAEARREAAKIMKENEEKIGKIREKSEAEAKKSIESIKKQALSLAEMEAKKMLLDIKKQAIDCVFSEARKILESLDEKKREALLKSIIEKAKNEIEVRHVYCSNRDMKFLKGFDVQPASMLGGLIAENSERTIRVDYSFEAMLEIIKEREMQSINKLLFG